MRSWPSAEDISGTPTLPSSFFVYPEVLTVLLGREVTQETFLPHRARERFSGEVEIPVTPTWGSSRGTSPCTPDS